MIRPVVTATISRTSPVTRVVRKGAARKDAVRLLPEEAEASEPGASPSAPPFDATGATWTLSAAGAPLTPAMQAALTRLRRGG